MDITEILVHWHAGRSKNEIAASLGVSRNTVRKYVTPAEEAGITPGGAAITSAEWAARVREWFPEVVDGRLRQVTWPTIDQHRDYIVAQLKAGVTVTTIHQRLRDEHGLAVSIASMRRYVHANLPEEVRTSQVRVLRLREAEPGAEAQIDYGQLGRWTDPKTGRRHMVQAFVMVLPASRHMFVYPVLKVDQHAWSSAHVAAFGFFGGCPARLVPDNLKTGVDRPDLYDPKINRAYAELAAHYGVLIDPARSRKPRDKASVERPMPYIRDSFWRGRSFTSLEEMRQQAERWCLEVAGRRPCRPLADAAPLVVFTAVEAERLAALPTTPFVLSRWSKAKVGPDIHARVDKVLYSIPWRYLGRHLDVRSTATMVQFFCSGELIKTHPRKLAGKQTDLADYPPEKVAFHLRTPAWCRGEAEQIGPACLEVVTALLADADLLYRLRAAQGVIGLADKHNPHRLEQACAKAIEVGDPSYRTIKGILAAGTETDPAPAGRGDGGADAFLHGPAALFADPPPGQVAEVIPLRGSSTSAAG
ncbi:IS21 family transposase [Microtetraspora sp. AC03309]|nr:IS21 family transposase [Microtetraspora sp. AC03309]MCC5582152.1 IS21 family transposase [Microtetraspora sp. AC03309]